MWQDLYGDLKDQGFTVIAVALDNEDAARPWIEKAAPGYPALVDREHRLAELYNFKNVPEATWIDEQGRIVRPPETAGAYEAFRKMDFAKGTMPPDEAEKRETARRVYYDALRDWVAKGAESRFAMKPGDARKHLARPTPESALGHAHFRLGAYLLKAGQDEEAARHMAEASRLHPESWAIWRQAAEKNDTGLAAGDAFWARVHALGDKRYYPPPPIDGMP